jgi:hypothetical protein
MARISWFSSGERVYEAGIDHGVLYVDDNAGVPWFGLIAVNQGQSGGQAKPRYLDGIKVGNRTSPEEFEATLEAFTYPEEFAVCDGVVRVENGLRLKQQRRKPFSMTYRSKIGNDLEGLSHGYRLHFLYNLTAEPSDHDYKTLTTETDAISFSWKLTARPPIISGYKPTAHLEIDSRDIPAELLQVIEDTLYGTELESPRLPSPSELIFLFDSFDDNVYDAGSPYTPVFVTYDAGTPSTPITETIDGGAL